MTRDEAIKILRGVHDKALFSVRNALETLIPELKESEDERIRKGLVNFLQSPLIKETLTDEKVAPWLAYLEKQKDCCGKTLIRDSGESACSYMERCLTPEMRKVWYEACAEKEKQKEQKPAERIEDDEEKSIGTTLIDALNGNARLEWELKRAGVDVKKLIIYLKQKEQQPAEWSEEDEQTINTIINHFKVDLECTDEDDIIVWLKELQYRLKSIRPLKQEWTEEDRKMLNTIISDGSRGLGFDAKQVNFLKSLCSQYRWKPSEQEKGALRTAIHVLTEERNFPKAAAHLQNILDAFEGEESRKDWRPSQEQMEALSWLVEYVAPSEKYIVLIKNLCEQLKKL